MVLPSVCKTMQSLCTFLLYLFDVLSHSTFLTFDIFYHSTFVPVGLFYFRRYVYSEFCPIRHFVIRHFVSFDVLSYDVLYFRRLLLQHFVGEPPESLATCKLLVSACTWPSFECACTCTWPCIFVHVVVYPRSHSRNPHALPVHTCQEPFAKFIRPPGHPSILRSRHLAKKQALKSSNPPAPHLT